MPNTTITEILRGSLRAVFQLKVFKRIVYQNMTILSLFIQHNVVLNLYNYAFYRETKMDAL